MASGMRCTLLLVLLAGCWAVALGATATANSDATAISNGGDANARANSLAEASGSGNAQANSNALAKASNGGNANANADSTAIANGGGDATANSDAAALANGGNANANAKSTAVTNGGGSSTANSDATAVSNGGNAGANAASTAVAGQADDVAAASADATAISASALPAANVWRPDNKPPFFPFPNHIGFCAAYQWLCKLQGKQACCHLTLPPSWEPSPPLPQACDGSAPQHAPLQVQHPQGWPNALCLWAPEVPQWQNCTWCCKGSGPAHDPIFTDFQNRTFEFFGEPGPIYNVLTHQKLSVNMKLTWAGDRHIRQQEGRGTFTDVLAFKFPETSVLVEVSEPGTMAVTIEDEDADLDKPFHLTKTDLNISFNPYVPGIGEELVLDDGLFKFTIVAVKAFEDEISGYNRGHLDLETEVSRPPGALDGVLGHSLYVRAADRLHEASVERKFHNDETDYIVKDLFDSMEIKQATSRRRRLIEGADLSLLQYPITASLSGKW